MKRITIALLTVAAVGVTVAGVAVGKSRHHDGRGPEARIDRMFERYDANKDGKITPSELAETRATRFAAADADSDGGLDRDELVAAGLERMRARVERRVDHRLKWHDLDGDGKLSAAEVGSGPVRRIARLDRDGDGEVTRAEAEAAAQRRGRRGEHGGWRRGHGGHDRGWHDRGWHDRGWRDRGGYGRGEYGRGDDAEDN